MSSLIALIVRLNAAIGVLFNRLRGPMGYLPPWLLLVTASVTLGILMLILFKYTSNQTVISRARDRIKAHLLSMRLFRDNLSVVFQAQVKIGWNVLLLLVHSSVPMLVMFIPCVLLFGQLGLWYQSRPLKVGEQAILVLRFAGSGQDPMPPVSLEPSDAARVTIGPVHVPSKRQVYWQIQAEKEGYHRLAFRIVDKPISKELAIGGGFMSVSTARSAPNLLQLLQYPGEPPFDQTSPVQSIRIDYPNRSSGLFGTDTWIFTLLAVSMATVFLCKPLFKVRF